jgi:predicted regulator of Ras-like GTPase activity (Roadblock/LC7/MglB family)
MIDLLPEGKSIGWMQAPPEWIFTHTSRFVGIVHVVIQDGEGFILIKKGKPLVYYFKHGRIELHGNGALDYFNTHQTIEFNLCKYTPEEFSQALKICNVEEAPPETATGQDQAPAAPAQADVVEQPEEEAAWSEITQPLPEPVMEKAMPVPAQQEVVVPVRSIAAVPERPVVPQPAILEDPEINIIGQIKKLNGIVAVSVFNDERNILLMGDVEIEPLLKIARAMLGTADKITPRLEWGSFVHMTLQIPEGNVIIAPWHENHLCILTTRTINIGHIRRILRDLQQDRRPGAA